MDHELTPDQVRRTFDPQSLPGDTTEDIQPLEGIIGQARAVSALEFGLGIQGQGFNIYVAGPPGSGKMTAIEAFLRKGAAERPNPPDWCYLTNFDDPYQPRAITLPTGLGRTLQQDMKSLVDQVRRKIPRAFEADEYSARRDEIKHAPEQEREKALSRLNEQAARSGFKLQAGSFGIALIPVVKGQPIDEATFNSLPESTRAEIEQRQEKLGKGLEEALKQIRASERAAQEQLEKLDEQVVAFIVGGLIQDLKEKYADLAEVTAFLGHVQRDICENIDLFKGSAAGAATPADGETVPASNPLLQELPFRKYQVNVLVDNSKQQGVPVVVELNPTYTNLFGRIERETHMGALYTDLTMIRAGAMQRANGGYLVLPVEGVLQNVYSWEALKTALRQQEIQIEELAERMGQFATKSLRPQPIPLDIKVILVGSPLIYEMLFERDEDFPQFFQVKADFDSEMPRTDENVRDVVAFLAMICEKEKLAHLDRSGIARVLEHSSRMADDQEKLTTHFGELVDVIREANYWARRDGAKYIARAHIRKALDARVYRASLIQDRVREMIARGTLLIQTSGQAVGQVNGLAVLALGDYEFGRPTRITASVGPGREGIVDIEREVQMGGPTHTKGVLILSGYLRHKYAPNLPLTVGARLVFEQSYQGIDGDSASSAELYALLSALSGLPIKQGIAVTGSVNQHGEVQAIGGVNEKIEGFFDVCAAQGLNGAQGVLIPQSNVQNLMLREDIVEAIRAGQFHVWAVATIDEGIEALTGVPSGAADTDGRFPHGTVNDCVAERLVEFNKAWRESRAEAN